VLSIGSLTRGSADTGPRFTALTDAVQAALTARSTAAPAAKQLSEEAPPS
jgi:cytochrome c biogenesis protein